MREEFNSVWNYELLDRISNGTSGPLLAGNIAAERAKQVAFDPTGRTVSRSSTRWRSTAERGETDGVSESSAPASSSMRSMNMAKSSWSSVFEDR
jgi:hypothetical protein